MSQPNYFSSCPQFSINFHSCSFISIVVHQFQIISTVVHQFTQSMDVHTFYVRKQICIVNIVVPFLTGKSKIYWINLISFKIPAIFQRGTFDWLDSFLEANPKYTELSDRHNVVTDYALFEVTGTVRKMHGKTHKNHHLQQANQWISMDFLWDLYARSMDYLCNIYVGQTNLAIFMAILAIVLYQFIPQSMA